MKTLLSLIFVLSTMNAFAKLEVKATEDGTQLFASTVTNKNKKEAVSEAKNEALRACIQKTFDPSKCSVIHQDSSNVEVTETRERLCGLICFMTAEFMDSDRAYKAVSVKKTQAIVIVKSHN